MRRVATLVALAGLTLTTGCMHDQYGGKTQPDPAPNPDHAPVTPASGDCEEALALPPGVSCVSFNVIVINANGDHDYRRMTANVMGVDAEGKLSDILLDKRSLPDVVPVQELRLIVTYDEPTTQLIITLDVRVEDDDFVSWAMSARDGHPVPGGSGTYDNDGGGAHQFSRRIIVTPPHI